jgi:hypothetical protein
MPVKPLMSYYARHRQEILARAKIRYATEPAHRERVRTTALAHYYEHRPEILARQKTDYANEPANARCQGSTRAEVRARRKARQSAAPLAWARYRLSVRARRRAQARPQSAAEGQVLDHLAAALV